MSIEEFSVYEKKEKKDRIEKLKQKLSQNNTNSYAMRQISELHYRLGEFNEGEPYRQMANIQDDEDFPEFEKNREQFRRKILQDRISSKKTQL